MPQITGAHHTSFTVADLDRSVAFFRDELGLELLVTREIREDYFDRIVGLNGARVKVAFFKIPGAAHHLELFQYLEPQGKSVSTRPCDVGSSHLALLIDDLQGWYDSHLECGATFVSKPVPILAGPNRGALALYVRDPNGVLIELFQLAPARAAGG